MVEKRVVVVAMVIVGNDDTDDDVCKVISLLVVRMVAVEGLVRCRCC